MGSRVLIDSDHVGMIVNTMRGRQKKIQEARVQAKSALGEAGHGPEGQVSCAWRVVCTKVRMPRWTTPGFAACRTLNLRYIHIR